MSKSWYWADLVMRVTVEGEARKLVHVNTHLVEAASDEEAHDKARAIGEESSDDYMNAAGKKVSSDFLGLANLNRIHEPLEDGAEIGFIERQATDEELARLVRDKAELAVFSGKVSRSGPDFDDDDATAAAAAKMRPPAIVGIHHAQVMVPKGALEQARSFYCGTLGLKEIPKPPPLEKDGGLWIAIGNQQLHLGEEREERTPASGSREHVAYEVTHLDAFTRKLEMAGVEVKMGEAVPGVYARCECRDPFGNRVELIQKA